MNIYNISEQISWVLFMYYTYHRNLNGHKYEKDIQSFISRNVISYFCQLTDSMDEIIEMGYFPLILWKQNPDNKSVCIPWEYWNIIINGMVWDSDNDEQQIFSLTTATGIDITFTKEYTIHLIDMYYY